MTDKQIIKNVYDMITKFNNIEGNKYIITTFTFRDILSREKFVFEYNFLHSKKLLRSSLKLSNSH